MSIIKDDGDCADPGSRSECCGHGDVNVSLVFKALGHPVRMSIMRCLASRDACCCGEVCAQLPLAQSTVSQHLDLLRKAGLVRMRQDGTRSRYSLDRDALVAISLLLAEIGGSADPGVRP